MAQEPATKQTLESLRQEFAERSARLGIGMTQGYIESNDMHDLTQEELDAAAYSLLKQANDVLKSMENGTFSLFSNRPDDREDNVPFHAGPTIDLTPNH